MHLLQALRLESDLHLQLFKGLSSQLHRVKNIAHAAYFVMKWVRRKQRTAEGGGNSEQILVLV